MKKHLLFLFIIVGNICGCTSDKKNKISESPDVVKSNVEYKKTNDSIWKLSVKSQTRLKPSFNYPKSKLFLDFYSGMTRNEFIKTAERLVNEGVLKKHRDKPCAAYDFDDKYISEYTYSYPADEFFDVNPGYKIEIKLNATFLREWNRQDIETFEADFFEKNDCSNYNYFLVSLELINARWMDNEYNKKYNVPLSAANYMIEVSKIGEYNIAYDPKISIELGKVSSSPDLSTLDEEQRKKMVDMPQMFVDKSKELDVNEKYVYYENKIEMPREKEMEIQINDSTILYFKNYWTKDIIRKLSLEEQNGFVSNISNPTFIMNRNELYSSQSKQMVITTNYEENYNITYTTKKYFIEKIKKIANDEESEKIIKSDSLNDKRDIQSEI